MSDRWQARISEYLDGELTPSESQRFERHLAECEECRTTLIELRQVVHQAAQLPAPEVPESIWEGVRARIELQGFESKDAEPTAARRPVRSPQSHWFSGIRALAAALLLAILAGGGGYWLRGSGHDGNPGNLDRAPRELANDYQPSMSNLPPELVAALADYEASVAQLEATLRAQSDVMESGLYETIEGNLETIDQAIFEARVALANDPQSEYLNAHLADSMMRKVRLLRQATQLANNSI